MKALNLASYTYRAINRMTKLQTISRHGFRALNTIYGIIILLDTPYVMLYAVQNQRL